MNLLQRKQQAKVAVQGVDLLKRKRDALVADFFNIVRQSLVARERLTKACEEAYVMLALAKAWEGREALEAAAMADRREVLVDIDIRNVKIEGDSAQVDYFGVMRYAIAVPNGEKWFSESDDQRMKFVKSDGDWKISSGM